MTVGGSGVNQKRSKKGGTRLFIIKFDRQERIARNPQNQHKIWEVDTKKTAKKERIGGWALTIATLRSIAGFNVLLI